MYLQNNCKEKQENTLKTRDSLNLSETFVPDIPKDIIFPDELNRYLRDKIRTLSHENGMLRKNLYENENHLKESASQLENLNNQLQKYQSVSNFSSASDVASVKIVELSKKLREKNSEVEVMKTKCSRLEQKIFELQKQNLQPNEPEEVPVRDKAPQEELEEEIKTLKDKLASANNKLFESLNTNSQLKNDLKVANKILQQETGETLDKLKSSSSQNSRGRAQIICDLQQKNADLKEKIKGLQEKCTIKETPTQIKNDKRVEQLTKENVSLKNEIQELKKKCEALRARCRVLESDCNITKTKLAAVADNNERDQLLINTLSSQISNLQNNHNEVLKQKQIMIQRMEKENNLLTLDVEREKLKTSTLDKEVKTLRQEIEKLNANLKKQSSQLTYENTTKDDKNLGYYQAERSRLLEVIAVSNERLEHEREENANTQSQLRVERQKNAKLEAKVARLHLEQHADRCSGYSTSSLNSTKCSGEGDSFMLNKLELAEENIKALQTRLEIEKNERKLDFVEFSKILQNYTINTTNDENK